ncbi:MAG: DNA mismatch repair endonuclease MutL, partial [Alphaproteobacteria bacterium]|nr:DNA mismatch repair endonuclease MutL [Alphaproteobacteria bacterium]
MNIRVLPSNLVNQIAAGEVIERPASVLKELVENAIDAGAHKIEISLVGGGKNVLTVTDDGEGMTSEELSLAVERHATSKLPDDDLFQINFLGFRGEALPSIGSVARLTITSRKKGSAEGAKICVEGGVKSKVEPAAISAGTRIEVRDLFYTTPARLKFLKADSSEAAQCADMLQHIALANPAVAFYLYSDGKKKMALNACEGDLPMARRQRIVDVLGAEFKDNSVPITAQNEFCDISGFVGVPTYNKANSLSEFLFVNNRPVRDKLILGAIKGAYQDMIMSGRYPVCAIFIRINSRYVDVNVHPTKAEVRFYDNGAVRGLLVGAIRNALSAGGQHSAETGDLERLLTKQIQDETAHLQALHRHTTEFSVHDYTPPTHDFRMPLKHGTSRGTPSLELPELQNQYSVRVAEEPSTQTLEQVGELGLAKAQFHNTYIISQTADSIIIIDQHAAHERITMERMKQSLAAHERVASQMLLIPEVVDLSLMEKENLLEYADTFSSLGLVIEEFG